MRVEHSHHSHHLVGSLEEGEELVDALTSMCHNEEVLAGELRVVGSFDEVELVRFNPATRQYDTVLQGQGQFDIVSIQGNVSRLGDQTVLRVEALLNVMGLVGPQLVAGQLRSARVVSCEFVVDVFKDLHMRRRLDPQRGLLVLDAIEKVADATTPVAEKPASVAVKSPAQPSAPERPTPVQAAPEPVVSKPAAHDASQMSWAQAVEEAESISKPASTMRPLASRSSMRRNVGGGGLDDEESEAFHQMKPGDMLDHPKLGMCRVMKVEDDDYAHIRLPRGKIRKLALEVCEIHYKGQENGRDVFQVRVRK